MSARERLGLYPPLEPYRQQHLKVDTEHEIFFEECGNPRGKPVVIVHGGPGGGCNASMRRYHDATRYRIVLFDQRGCGRSAAARQPESGIPLGIWSPTWSGCAAISISTRWQLFGGSWGSTLALAYAQTHAERVSELVLRGIFLLRREELAWFYQDGCSWLFPEAFERIPQAHPARRAGRHDRRLPPASHPSRSRGAAGRRAGMVGVGGQHPVPGAGPERIKLFGADNYAIAFARIECHYFVNRGFFRRDDQLLADVGVIRHLPCTIVHGRYDVVTPVKNAWDLSRTWPEADLRIVADAGHATDRAGRNP